MNRSKQMAPPMDFATLKDSIATHSRRDFPDTSVRVCCDSRQVKQGDIFVAVHGPLLDGHDYIQDALSRGASIIVAEKENGTLKKQNSLLIVKDSAYALAELAQTSCGNPAKKLINLGITGTNGKTTVAYLTRFILQQAHIPCGMIGTTGYDTGSGDITEANCTTPGPLQIAELMSQMVSHNQKAVVMECSSHGLHQSRLEAIDFHAAAFTNLTGDHLDYHKTTESYLHAKRKLFTSLGNNSVAVLNQDDSSYAELRSKTHATVWAFSLTKQSEIHAKIDQMNIHGSHFTLDILGQKQTVHCPLPGRHNISNALAAAGLAHAAGVEPKTIAHAITHFPGVPGRFQRIDQGQDFTVLVDYAHTDDALNHALKTLAQLKKNGRLIVVFGCGGQRDQSKRPRMAKVAEQWADRIILTQDNPRQEDPNKILAQIRAGFSEEGLKKMTEIPDRKQAIESAIAQAQTGDLILIAGKGHETCQIIGSEKNHFDDREIARESLEKTRV